jgi:hypothetical protein
MRIVIAIDLGNEAMQTMQDVADALAKCLTASTDMNEPLLMNESGRVRDLNGNTVGAWEVVDLANGSPSWLTSFSD